LHLLRRILQVVVHRDHVSSACVAQPGHYSVVLAVVASEVDKGHWDPRVVEKNAKNLKAIIDAAVIHKYDFMPARDREALKRADEFRDATRAVEDRDDNRQGEA